MCKVYLPSVFECFIQVAAVDGSVLLRFEVDDLKEAQCLETSFEFAFVGPDRDFIQGIKKKAELPVASFKIDIYSLKEN